jgi:nitroreductase
VDPYLAIASKRDERAYTDTPVSAGVRERILDAGRLSGSSKNRQRWEFVVVTGEARDRLAETVYAPENIASAALVVAIVGEAGAFDTGRCAQNMMLAAWGEGVASCPNGVRDPDAAAEICGGEVRAILSFGHPARQRDPASRTAEEWSARANRKPLSELVRELG